MQDDEAARVATIVERLRQAYPDATCSLRFSNPLELLVATILSAQCTDERVNAVTGRLFTTYRSAADYANAPPEELEAAIKPTGFYRAKARHIQAACRMIAERHNGEVPRQMEQLTAIMRDRKSTRLNSSHEWISYAVFCLKKKKKKQ